MLFLWVLQSRFSMGICFYGLGGSFLLFISILQRHSLCAFAVKNLGDILLFRTIKNYAPPFNVFLDSCVRYYISRGSE